MMLAEDRLNEWYSTCYLMRYMLSFAVGVHHSLIIAKMYV